MTQVIPEYNKSNNDIRSFLNTEKPHLLMIRFLAIYLSVVCGSYLPLQFLAEFSTKKVILLVVPLLLKSSIIEKLTRSYSLENEKVSYTFSN